MYLCQYTCTSCMDWLLFCIYKDKVEVDPNIWFGVTQSLLWQIRWREQYWVGIQCFIKIIAEAQTFIELISLGNDTITISSKIGVVPGKVLPRIHLISSLYLGRLTCRCYWHGFCTFTRLKCWSLIEQSYHWIVAFCVNKSQIVQIRNKRLVLVISLQFLFTTQMKDSMPKITRTYF